MRTSTICGVFYMKINFLFGLLCLSYIHTLERGDLEKCGYFDSEFFQCSVDKTSNSDVSDLDVYFYNFPKHDGNHFKIHNAANGILTFPHLDISRRLFIYVAGSTSNITTNSIGLVRNAFKDIPNYYFIVLDYMQYTIDPKTNENSYKFAVNNSYHIGKALADMLSELRRGGIATRNMHCLGYSLGGQILGYTGQSFYQNTGEKLPRITALDPARPCFSERPIEEQVGSGVAEYVEVYHCNAGSFGTDRILGDIDFFLNERGQTQPGCGTPFIPNCNESEKAALCDHITCVDVWASTVKHGDWFTAVQCDSYDDFKNGLCEGNNTTRAGFWNPGTAQGTYYFNTGEYDSAL